LQYNARTEKAISIHIMIKYPVAKRQADAEKIIWSKNFSLVISWFDSAFSSSNYIALSNMMNKKLERIWKVVVIVQLNVQY
jgi:hypothetical protein